VAFAARDFQPALNDGSKPLECADSFSRSMVVDSADISFKGLSDPPIRRQRKIQ
jgi:hypothetical protein